MVGKDSHRPEGKAGIDPFHTRASQRGVPRVGGKPVSAPAPSRYDAEEQIGGSRPGVPSRMRDGPTPESDDE